MAKNTKLKIETLRMWLKDRPAPKQKTEETFNDYSKPVRIGKQR